MTHPHPRRYTFNYEAEQARIRREAREEFRAGLLGAGVGFLLAFALVAAIVAALQLTNAVSLLVGVGAGAVGVLAGLDRAHGLVHRRRMGGAR